jgi:hypothetical protein
MEPLNGYSGFIGMFAAAIISGAIGGFVFELMPGNSDVHIGLLKIPGGSKTGGNPINLGFLSNVLLGAVAAVAILYFFPPETQTITMNDKGVSQTSYSYDLIKLVALSLIVGSAGPSFLSSIQGRLTGALNAQKEADANVIDKLAQSMQTLLEEHHDAAKNEVTTTVNEMVGTAPVVVSANGNHDRNAVLGLDEPVGERQKVVDATVTKLHTICDNTVADLKAQLQTKAETAKREVVSR